MASRVRLRDGIEISLTSGKRLVLDGDGAGDYRFLSHAHADHLFGGFGPVNCSELTAALAAERRDEKSIGRTQPPNWIDLRKAGHIAGSRSALVTDPVSGRRYCFTGDLSTRTRFYLEGFRPPDADVLIIESTYGDPAYRFPRTEVVVNDMLTWLADTRDEIAVIFGHPLGRAQKLQLIAQRADRDRLLVSESVHRLNSVIERHREIDFSADCYRTGMAIEPGDVLVLPTQMNRDTVREKLAEQGQISTAGVSGWASDESYRYRGSFDATFPLSDHCDFDELVGVVKAVDPERVYTHHGFAEEFANYLTRNHGYETRALRRNQATLGDF